MPTPASHNSICVPNQDIFQYTAATTSLTSAKHTPLTRSGGSIVRNVWKTVRPSRTELPLDLTECALLSFDDNYSKETASFDSETKSRVLQNAGQQIGFNLRLECYEQAPSSLADWLEHQSMPTSERSIFKDRVDIEAVDAVAMAFDAALANDSSVYCGA